VGGIYTDIPPRRYAPAIPSSIQPIISVCTAVLDGINRQRALVIALLWYGALEIVVELLLLLLTVSQ